MISADVFEAVGVRIDDLIGARAFYWEVSYLLPELAGPLRNPNRCAVG